MMVAHTPQIIFLLIITLLYLYSLETKNTREIKTEIFRGSANHFRLISSEVDTNKIDEESLNIKRHNLLDEYFDLVKDGLISLEQIETLKQIDDILLAGKKAKNIALANNDFTLNSMFQGCSNESYPPQSELIGIKTYQINLDNKPEERWKELVQEKKDEINRLADLFEYKFGGKVMGIVDKYIDLLHYTLPREYMSELDGIAAASGINIGRVTLYNIFYELFTVCTSIIVEAEDGHIYHGRNLDFGLFLGWDKDNHTWYITELLRPLIVKLEFIKNGEPLYSAVSYAGFTGILTGVKKGLFSLTIDERFILDGGYMGLAAWILGSRDSHWLGLLTRQVMEQADSYDEAREMLITTPLVAPVYFILAGSSHEGCIVTRGRQDADVWPLGSKHSGQTGDWFLLETNYDHWQETPFFDQRRQYAVQCMDQLGRHQPLDTLYKVLSTRPVLNKETTLTALMDVSAGLLQVWPRDCKDPCWPF